MGPKILAMVPCTDFERATKFYSEVVGLKRVEMGAPGDVATFEFSDDSGRVTVYKTDTTGGTATRATFMVGDVQKTVDELAAKGVKFEHYEQPWGKTDEKGIMDMGGAKSAWFKDPDGNVLAVLAVA